MHEVHAGLVAAVEIYGSHESLECVSFHIAVMRGSVSARLDEPADAYLVCKAVERFALHDFAPGVGEETLALALEVPEDDVAHDGIEDGVAEKFKTLVVDGLALGVAPRQALVHQGLLVETDVVGIEPHHLI